MLSALKLFIIKGSIMTRYADNDTGFWKALRRGLVGEGLPRAAINEVNNEQNEVGFDSEFLGETYELLNSPSANPNHLSRYRQNKFHND